MPVIDLSPNNHCICQRYENTQEACINEYTIMEQGKSVTLEPKNGEQVTAIIIDGCLITDNDPKCDALFLYDKGNRKFSFLVELKGAGDLPRAFKQLSYTRDNRREYWEIINRFNQTGSPRVQEKFVIVSNGMLSKPEIEVLEREYHILVKQILHSEPTTPRPDLKELI